MAHRSWKIGVDFGSTYSSVAFCQASGSEQGCVLRKIYSVHGSRHVGSRSDNQVREFPTIIIYEDEGRLKRWGWQAQTILDKSHQLDPKQPIYVVDLFKAGLNDGIESQLVREKLAALPFRKSIDDVVTDYLTLLLDHTKLRMADLGYEELDHADIICTVPAMWSARARSMTLEAAKRAKDNCGFRLGREVQLCYEPAAAAAYVFQHKPFSLKKDDAFVIADGGGATMDLITYVTASVKPLRISEVVPGTGQLCGSSYVNRHFEAYVNKRLADEHYLREQPNSKSLDDIVRFDVMKEFEATTKRDYPISPWEEGNEDSMYTTYAIPGVRDNSSKGFSKGDMVITRRQLEAVFLPVLEECWALIEMQLRKAHDKSIYPKMLILVGGFAGSYRYVDYIKERCQWFNDQQPPQFRIKVIIPPTPGSAIAKGAVRYLLDSELVQDHFSRFCFCITRNLQYDRPPPQFKDVMYKDDLDGKKYVRNCIHILLGMNEVIPSTGRTVKKRLYRLLGADQDVASIEMPIYIFEKHDGVQDHPIKDQKNQDHYRLGIVNFEVEIAPIRDQLKKMKIGTNKSFNQPMAPARRSGRSHHRKGLEAQKVSHDYSDPANIIDQMHRARISPGGIHTSSDGLKEQSPYYFLIEYIFEVKFIGVWMEWYLRIENVEGSSGSSTGQIDLTAYLDRR